MRQMMKYHTRMYHCLNQKMRGNLNLLLPVPVQGPLALGQWLGKG